MPFDMAAARVNLLYNGYHDEKHDKIHFIARSKEKLKEMPMLILIWRNVVREAFFLTLLIAAIFVHIYIGHSSPVFRLSVNGTV